MRKKLFTPLRKILIGATAIAVTVSTVAPTNASEAEAAVYKMNTGFIISDSQFYHSDAMSTEAIKKLLKEMVPRPTSRSLINYTEKTKSKKADAYCKAYSGGKRQSAAAIIRNVGKACGISQKVLLVMLQKETSLVTMAAPGSWRYDRAMGYSCPDSGPGYTANCNTSFYGFFNQVYSAARQLKRYGIDPAHIKVYPLGKTKRIQYHPNPSCGTGAVKVVNKATAALYRYTPYVPNSAVLRGKPNGCSSYGNLNFHSIYSAWFGSPTAARYAIEGYIRTAYNANGKAAKIGKATGKRSVISAHGGGLQQRFQKGIITYSTKHKKAVFIPNGRLLTAYLKAGGPTKQGWPRTKPSCKLKGGGCRLMLTDKTIVQSKKTGARFVQQKHYRYWASKGSKRYSTFGYPVASTKTTATGTLQRYEKAIVAINKKGKITTLRKSPILSAYIKSGWHKSSWGMPTKVGKNAKTVRFENGVAQYRGGKVTFTRNTTGATQAQTETKASAAAPAPTPQPQETPEPELRETPEQDAPSEEVRTDELPPATTGEESRAGEN